MRWRGWGQYDTAFQASFAVRIHVEFVSNILILKVASTVAELGAVAQSLAKPLWVQAAQRSTPTSSTFFHEDLVMKIF